MASRPSRHIRFSQNTKRFLETLSRESLLTFTEAVIDLAQDPSPERGVNLGLGFPYRPDIYGLAYGPFWIAYFVDSDRTLWIANVAWGISDLRDL